MKKRIKIIKLMISQILLLNKLKKNKKIAIEQHLKIIKKKIKMTNCLKTC